MDPATYMKRHDNVGKSQSDFPVRPEVAPKSQSDFPAPTKYLLVTCRALTADENKVLAKNFQTIIVYHAGLNGQMDLSKMAFDLLVVDASKPENHLFLEIVTPSCAQLNIPILLLKKKFSNCKALGEGLGAYIVSRIEALDGVNFFRSLVKTKLPHLENRLLTFIKKVFAFLSK